MDDNAEPTTSEAGAPESAPIPSSTEQAPERKESGAHAKSVPRSTIAGRFWIVLGGAVVVIILLIIFIAENSQRVTVHFLGANGTISAALALLIAAVAGAIIVLLVGTVRILQLRGEVKKERRHRRGR
jgi:uncharacterized integral membrane protein